MENPDLSALDRLLTEMAPQLHYSDEGRSGTIHFISRTNRFDLWYELAVGGPIAIINIPDAQYWEAQTHTPLALRPAILRFISEQVIKDKVGGNGYFLHDEENFLTIYSGRKPGITDPLTRLERPLISGGIGPLPKRFSVCTTTSYDLSGMQTLLCYLLLLFPTVVPASARPATPPPALNAYVAFLSRSADELNSRFHQLQAYQAEVKRYRKKPDFQLRLPSSGPLETYYFQKALAGDGLTVGEKKQLTTSLQAIWQSLNKLDQTTKALETYVRLNDYQRDNLSKSDTLTGELQTLFGQFSRDKNGFYQQIQQVYRRYQPYVATDPYLATEKEMEQVLLNQHQLLAGLPYYLDEDSPSVWPVRLVQQSMLADERLLAGFGKSLAKLGYPAADMVKSFKSAIQSMQDVKGRAIDDNTFAARQSARHGNEVYLALLNHYNQDVLASHQAFVRYSQPTRQLLDYPTYSLVFTMAPSTVSTPPAMQTAPFLDKTLPGFSIKPAVSPMSSATFRAFTGYVEFINEALRQMHFLQLTVRNYQASAEYHRDPTPGRKRADLTYSHDDFKVPKSAYQLLLTASQSIPLPYRSAISTQAEVLMNVLTEMDELSIELIAYTTQKLYLHDQLQRSDTILDRYAYLFDTFDRKKEQLYTDVRRMYESYPVANPASSWTIAGKALLKTLDDDRDVLFGVKAFLADETSQLPAASKLEVDARQLISDEYKNLKGLQRYGRSNGLCPYSPYEDIAEHTSRFMVLSQTVKKTASTSGTHPYESFYYFYNNQFIYEYNKFCELANGNLLKAINQPDVFAFRRLAPATPPLAQPLADLFKPDVDRATDKTITPSGSKAVTKAIGQKSLLRDTVYVERTKVDTIYIDRTGEREVSASLSGFAPNNMVLLLDVSGSMDSPYKLPLLKRSIKALLALLRPEDQLSIVVYSGKAKLALKPTSGADVNEIARVIDALESTGDTDGNGGFKLAYKVANRQYIRAGNNRIILATDGEFPVNDEVLQLIEESARQDIYLTVFTFGRNALTGQNLKKLSQLGRGTYTHVTAENANSQLILEAQAKKLSPK